MEYEQPMAHRDLENPHAIVQHPLKGEFDVSRAQWLGSGRIQVAFVDNLIGMRDGQQPDGPVLVFTEEEWDAFVAGAKDGEFDLPGPE
jgi:hypothetical protein